jgi:hypothetical protein
MRTRHTFIATTLVALLALAGVTAAVAADPAGPPPPRIAFVANGIVPADALAAGPIAGQLGAPVYTTAPDALPGTTRDALAAYAPQLVIVLGGSVAITDGVVNAIAAATGLPTVAPTPPPTTGVVRAAGGDRYETAAIVGDLLSAYDPAYLGVDLQSVDADLLDGKDSSEFLSSADGSVGTDEVADGSLRLADIAVFSDKINVNPPLVPSNSCITQTQVATGVDFEDITYIRPSANIGNVTVHPVSPLGDGTFRYRLCNPTGVNLDPPSGAWKFVALRP